MSLPYDQFDDDIKRLIRQGCSPNEASKQLLRQYPQLIREAAQILQHVQAIERNLGKAGW